MSRQPNCDRSPFASSLKIADALRVCNVLILSLLQANQKIGGQDRSGLADLVENMANDDEEKVHPSVNNKKKKGASLSKAFEHMQGAPMLYPDEVLVI